MHDPTIDAASRVDAWNRDEDIRSRVHALRIGALWDGARTIMHRGRTMHAERGPDGGIRYTLDGAPIGPDAFVAAFGECPADPGAPPAAPVADPAGGARRPRRGAVGGPSDPLPAPSGHT